MYKFLQINLNGDWAAQQLMAQIAIEKEAYVILISEPFLKCRSDDKWCFSHNRKAAVAIAPRGDTTFDSKGSSNGFAWMSLWGLTVYGCY